MGSRATGAAPAKINLVLEVTGRRADGYHEVDTILQTLELADQVTLTFDGSAPLTMAASGPFAEGTPVDETNLAVRALTLLGELADRTPTGVTIHLEKNIPPAGGLGGGASDAVTAMRLIQPIWNVSDAQLRDVANRIGSDEAFFLVGGTARATGRGEVVVSVPPLLKRGVVLLVPRQSIDRKTPRLFAALSMLPFEHPNAAERFVTHPHPDFASKDVYNAFERVAFTVFEGLGDLRTSAEARTGEQFRLAGAGPTLFWIGDLANRAQVAAAVSELDCLVVETATT